MIVTTREELQFIFALFIISKELLMQLLWKVEVYVSGSNILGGEPEVKDNSGETPLHYVCFLSKDGLMSTGGIFRICGML